MAAILQRLTIPTAKGDGMVSRQQSSGDIKRTIVERLSWQAARRDDATVARAVYEGAEVEAIYNLDEAGLLDEFYAFLARIGFLSLVAGLDLPGVERVLIPVVQFILLYLLKTLLGIESMNSLPALLFSNVALMTLIGFNAYQVSNGFTRRGDARRRKKAKQGPLTPQCLAQNISKFSEKQMEDFFNGVVRLIVRLGLVAGEISVALDGTKLRTTEKYEGRGCVKVEHEAKEKGSGRLVKVVEFIFGWKLLVLIEVRTRLPLAAKVVKIEAYEGEWLVPLVRQAQANLGAKARIVKVLVDRGYLDGEDLWDLDQMGIIFVVIAKSGMAVREDAHALAREGTVVERVREVRHGHGRKATSEKVKTRLVGIEALTTYDDYGTAEHSKQKNRKSFVGNALNAVVILTWENREYGERGTVYLTNGPVQDPFVVFDDYDWRSVIENGTFKEGKNPWKLEHFPQKTEEAVVVHCFFTLVVLALCTAFRLWQASDADEDEAVAGQEEKAEGGGQRQPGGATLEAALLGGEGTERWRRRLKQENRDKVIVFVGEHYGIFHIAQMATLSGVRIKSIPHELGSRETILSYYGLSP